jgi:hypothetical protein
VKRTDLLSVVVLFCLVTPFTNWLIPFSKKVIKTVCDNLKLDGINLSDGADSWYNKLNVYLTKSKSSKLNITPYKMSPNTNRPKWDIKYPKYNIPGVLYFKDIFIRADRPLYVKNFSLALDDENKTIGIILCKEKNNAIVEMTLPENNNHIYASKFQTILPSKEELKKQLEEID